MQRETGYARLARVHQLIFVRAKFQCLDEKFIGVFRVVALLEQPEAGEDERRARVYFVREIRPMFKLEARD